MIHLLDGDFFRKYDPKITPLPFYMCCLRHYPFFWLAMIILDDNLIPPMFGMILNSTVKIGHAKCWQFCIHNKKKINMPLLWIVASKIPYWWKPEKKQVDKHSHHLIKEKWYCLKNLLNSMQMQDWFNNCVIFLNLAQEIFCDHRLVVSLCVNIKNGIVFNLIEIELLSQCYRVIMIWTNKKSHKRAAKFSTHLPDE